ncbi:porin [Candidatus Pelagibacter bacterium nBUS_25]|uniref:porin n=1 Tax=Candidatus Pelagibacter bacterium nBUS_25 TaxID=3374187 RepID=UPI003EB97CD7
MTNFKKIGLTALAGSLIATTAMAGSLSVSGGAKMSYTSKGGTTDSSNTGNSFGMQKAMTFSGGGELDNGHSVSLTHVMTVEGAQSSSLLTYDMGDMGKVMYTDAAGGLGVAGIDDLMPTAVEEIWDGLGGTKNGYASSASSGFEYTNTSVDGVKVEIGYSPDGQAANDDGGVSGTGSVDSSSSVAIQYTGIDGANIFYGTGSQGVTSTTENNYDTMGVTYAMGAATVGVQLTDVDPASGNDEENTAFGISFAVNDDLSISYGESTVEVSGSVDQELKGFSVGYSMGGLTLQAHANEGDNVGNTANNYQHTELTVSFAF